MTPLQILHEALAWSAVALCLAGIVHPRLPTGVLGTAGLGTCLVGILYSLDDWHDAQIALDIVTAGLVLIGVCLAWRLVRRPDKGMMRRVKDWMPTWEAETLPPELRDAVRGGNKPPPAQ